MSDEQVRDEWERLQAAFAIRQEVWDRLLRRQALERDLAFGDLARAGKAREAFLREHPECKEPLP